MEYKNPFKAKFPNLPKINGIKLAVGHSGMYYKDRDDLLLITLPEKTEVAGIFTKNTIPGAPVKWCKKILSNKKARALVVNSGISNVFGGEEGLNIVAETAKEAAKLLGCKDEEVYISSTGVIGELPNLEKIKDTLPKLTENLSEYIWEEAAATIMTTDTFAKGVTKTCKIGDSEITLNGFIKGSGMIAPDMATMLGYVFTDADLSAEILQQMLDEDKETSYNSITVDSDTSTSDTVLAFATRTAKHPEIKDINDTIFADFRAAFKEINIELAKLVVKDGEGITKLVTVNVNKAISVKSARKIALSIANSPLVKTAISGEDPNWGRIAMAIGKSLEIVKEEKIKIYFGDIAIANEGKLAENYDENLALTYMKNNEIIITIDLGLGTESATVYTSDLSHHYININADYRS